MFGRVPPAGVWVLGAGALTNFCPPPPGALKESVITPIRASHNFQRVSAPPRGRVPPPPPAAGISCAAQAVVTPVFKTRFGRTSTLDGLPRGCPNRAVGIFAAARQSGGVGLRLLAGKIGCRPLVKGGAARAIPDALGRSRFMAPPAKKRPVYAGLVARRRAPGFLPCMAHRPGALLGRKQKILRNVKFWTPKFHC